MANTYTQPAPLQDAIIPGGQLVDISSASISYAPIPFGGIIVDAFATISAAITGTDCVVTVKVIKGGVTSTVGVITALVSGSAPGSTFQMVMSGSETIRSVKPGDTIVFDSGGESSTTSIANFAAVIRRT